MGVRVAYGKKGRISAAIASGTIPKDSLIITSDSKESELYFYDANGEMKNISERKQFETLTEAQAWVKTYDCAGHIISVHNGSDWVPYIVSADGKLSPVNAGDIKSVSDEFTVSAEGKLEVKEVAPAKVTGLPDALAGKVDKVAGKGLSANDYTDEEKEKLGGVEAGANKNLIEIIKLAGAALNISEKAVNIPFAGDTAGVVTSSTGENKVAVAEDGSMEVNSLNMNKLVQSDGDTLILDGGNAAV